ncbi:hypothetical protein [Kitasatospora sp. NPDC056184]|uniref:hypothetical protein n=1 Tax=Kitasatospora sp. NPDC056184 TaxID=3345738 RepID=UPI0035D8F2B2
MEKLIPEKLFPTERATAGHRLRIVATLAWPVTGLMTGTPVLIRRLTAPQRERRAEAAALQAKQDQIAALATEAAEAAFAKKIAGEPDAAKRAAMIQSQEAAEVTARQVALERAKADRKAARSKFGDTAGAAALLLIVGGPLVWSLARPLIEPGIGLLLGGWWIAALLHAPSPVKTHTASTGEDVDAPAADNADDGQEQTEPVVSPALAPAELAATIEHMVALRVQGDGGAGKVLLSEVLASLQRHGRYPGASTRDFGAAVRAAGLPVEKRVRVGEAISPGLTAAGLTAHLGHPPRLPAHAVPDHTPAEAA